MIKTAMTLFDFFILFALMCAVALTIWQRIPKNWGKWLRLLNQKDITSKKNRIKKIIRPKNALSLEIEHNLKILSDFSKKICVPADKPISMKDAFEKSRRVVASHLNIEGGNNNVPPIYTIRADIFMAWYPKWHIKIFSNQSIMDSLSLDEASNVIQFYDNLFRITSIYQGIKGFKYKADSVIKLEQELINATLKTIEIGHPLKSNKGE